MTDEERMPWLLTRIKQLETLNNPKRLPTHRNIWAGSFDVWLCEQDRLDAQIIPKVTMQKAEVLDYIKSHKQMDGKYEIVVWSLTDKGVEFLTSHK